MTHNQKKSKLSRLLRAKIKGQKLYDPVVFLSPKRIDIAAKTIFARAYLEGNPSSWPEYVYREHVRSFNNFIEVEPKKHSYEEFRDSFVNTIKGVRDDDTWKHEAPVQRSEDYLVNGAHRVAASIALGDKVNTVVPSLVHNDDYDYNYFRRDRSGIDGIDEDVLDYMTIEYVSLKKRNIFIAIIFPAAEGKRQEAYSHLLGLGEIVNMKTFKHNEFIGKEIIKQLYFDSNNDAWNYGLDFNSAKNKASWCFDGTDDLQVYVIEANLDESTRIREKQYLRDLWNKEKNSIHITDTIEEANRVVRMFFNENSRRFMKIERVQEFESQKMYDMFNEYIKLAPKNILEREKVAVEGSAVLDLLNIRPGRDIDYISRDSTINFKSDNIEKHGADENSYHSQSVDEIITNPKFFFYYKGYKFVDILELKKYKQLRSIEGNPKDANDVRNIDTFLKGNVQYNLGGEGSPLSIPLVSVIVPIYNTSAEYLAKCLDSIKNQSYPSIEVIIVDDGSDKQTAEYIKAYVRGMNNTGAGWRLIRRKRNGGLSSARNAGYANANGVYVQFIDSDDYIYRRLIESAVKKAESTGAEIVIENFTILDYETGSERVAFQESDFPPNQIFKLSDIEHRKIGAVPYGVWSKLFKKDFLDTHSILHDEDLHRAEDILFTYSALMLADRITLLPEFYITYREDVPGSNSQTNNLFPVASIDSWRALRARMIGEGCYGVFRSDYEIAALESLLWHYNRLSGTEQRSELAVASVAFAKEIGIEVKNNDYLVLSLASQDESLVKLWYEVIELWNERTQNLERTIEHLTIELNHLRKPGVKLASLKLAGAVKRKAKKLL